MGAIFSTIIAKNKTLKTSQFFRSHPLVDDPFNFPVINFFHRPAKNIYQLRYSFSRMATSWAWKFYPRNTRVNIGPPIIPAGEKIKFRIPRWNSDLKPKNTSHINFRPCGYTVSTIRSRGDRSNIDITSIL